jgi:hypothetical protein
MRWGTSIVDQHRSYPHGPSALRVDDTDTYQLQAAARELHAHLLHEQARHLAEVRILLADRYERDGIAVEAASLDAQAVQVAAQQRGERFLAELASCIHPDGELLTLARQLDDHGLGVWREAAASLLEVCPPSLASLRWRVEEEQRAELRGHAHLVRTEAQLGAQLRRLSVVQRWWHHGSVVEQRGRLADCRRRRERSGRRLAHLDAQLQVIDRAEQARSAWITQARKVLARGLAAAQVLAERQQRQVEQQHDGRPRAHRELAPAAVRAGRAPLSARS